MDALRGLAAFGVCVGHLVICNAAFFPGSMIRDVGSLGHYGVEVFFVISGFIIPYSLHRADYLLRNWPAFVAKRMLRLEPPYLCTILLVLLLLWITNHVPGYQGEPFNVTWQQVLLHLGYINVFFNYPWLLTVFWTLAIEFQYYLLVGLVYPLLVHRRVALRFGALGALAAMAFLLPAAAFIFHYWFLFALGLSSFYFRRGLITVRPYVALLVAAAAGAAATLGWAPAAVGITASLLIAFAHWRHPMLNFLGMISYSLYLTHLPIGGRIVNLGLRRVQTLPGRLALLVLATAGSIGFAWAFYYLIERPAQRWSKAVQYRSRTR